MNRFNPDDTDADGRRRIASHQYPLIEPYDSNDPYLLECHVLLMKLSGVDGVVVDWYGTEDLHDYATLHRNTEHLLRVARRAGLAFALCYEDRTLREAVRAGRITEDAVGTQLGDILRHLGEGWFTEPLYLKHDRRPVLLVFGPEYADPSAWDEAFASLPKRPVLLTLANRRAFADGAFAWVPMWQSRDGVLSHKDALDYLRSFGETATAWNVAMTAAFPGFHDIYADAGVQPSYGVLDARDGATFRETLSAALQSPAPFVQLVTWNDFGEGTAIEPTADAGYRDLEAVQQARRLLDPAFRFAADDLRLPVALYQLRKRLPTDAAATEALDGVALALLDGRVGDAREALSQLQAFDEP
jgi:hypothetical protein